MTVVSLALTALLGVQPVLKAGRNGVPSIGTVGAELAVLDVMGRGGVTALAIGVLIMTIGVSPSDLDCIAAGVSETKRVDRCEGR